MEILQELHRPRRVDFRVADPDGLAYQSYELAEVGLLKPTNAYVVGVIHSPLVSIIIRLVQSTALRFQRIVTIHGVLGCQPDKHAIIDLTTAAARRVSDNAACPSSACQSRPYFACSRGSTSFPIVSMTRITLAASMPGQPTRNRK